MQIRQLMSQYVEVIHPDVSVTAAAQTMSLGDVGPLPVWDGERLLGILTDRDIVLRVVAAGRDPQTTPVREFAKLVGACGTLCAHDALSFLPTTRHEARWL
jgi:CBS domain-containing protein